MNKLIIVLLAVCLVSVHAFVRRDAPAPAEGQKPSAFDDVQKSIKELAPKIQEFGNELTETLKKAFDPEKIQKGVEDALSTVNKAMDDAKTKFVGTDAPGEKKA